uniref:Uncharacterized protein n=1 Tax=Avena sativa TaxID=4498 RepID=A0ACD5Y470_AVESA
MMEFCIPPTENQALGPRLYLHSSSFLALARFLSLALALALRGGTIARAPAKLARWLSMDPRPSPDLTRDNPPPHRAPILLDPAQLAAATAVLEFAIVHGRRSIDALKMPRVDSSDSDSSDDDGVSGHTRNRHHGYPLIHSLQAGDPRLFFVPGSAPTGLPDARQGDAVHRLSDVHDNSWILKAGAETFAGPCGLTNETTQTWIMRLKITTKLVGLIKQQLREQNWEQYFSEVAGQPLEQLLVVACSFSDAIWSADHISQMLTVFDALVDVLFNIKDLPFSSSGEVAGIVNKMVHAFKGVILRTVIPSSKESTRESTIHPATFVLIQVLEFFCRNRDMVQLILESGDYNTGPCSDMFNCLISKLKEFAEIKFQEKEKGKRYIFVLNNIYYVLQKKCHPGLLPPSAVSNLVSLVDQYIARYLEEYWFPPMLSYLDGDSLKKPCRSFVDTFMEEFYSICDSQMTWKVQTELKKTLRQEIVKLIVPKYVNFLKALQQRRSSHSPWLKWMSRARSEKPVCSAERLELMIMEIFEG